MGKKRNPDTFVEWLGLRNASLYKAVPSLGPFFGVILVLVLVFLIYLAVNVVIQFTHAVTGAIDDSGEAIRNIGLVLAALIGVPFVIWRSIVAQKQVNVAEQSHITDRISKAVEQLGAEKLVKHQILAENGKPLYEEVGAAPAPVETTEPNIEVRLGGIYALERIGKDSPQDHLQIMEILTAYIRENAPASGAETPPTPPPEEPMERDGGAFQAFLNELAQYYQWGGEHYRWVQTLSPRTDIQAAITVIGRRGGALRVLEFTSDANGQQIPIRLDLRKTCLQGADMAKGYFENAFFNESDLVGVRLIRAKLNRAVFDDTILNDAALHSAELNEARLTSAKLNGANLDSAMLNGAALNWAELNGADLKRAILDGAELHWAQLNGARLIEARLNEAMLNSACLNGAWLICSSSDLI
jgi:pentapeptide repeat protein